MASMSQSQELFAGPGLTGIRIDRVEGDVMAVNSFLVHGPHGVIVVDAQLTVPDAQKVQRAVSPATPSSSVGWRSRLARPGRGSRTWTACGRSTGRSVLTAQRRYIDTFVEVVTDCADLDPAQRRAQVVDRMRPWTHDERLLFLMELSIEPVRDALVAH